MVGSPTADSLRFTLNQPAVHQTLQSLTNRSGRDTHFVDERRNGDGAFATDEIQHRSIAGIGLRAHGSYLTVTQRLAASASLCNRTCLAIFDNRLFEKYLLNASP